MASRKQPVDDLSGLLGRMAREIRLLKETQSRRVLPPGYEFTHSGGTLSIRRTSDGAQQAVAFDD